MVARVKRVCGLWLQWHCHFATKLCPLLAIRSPKLGERVESCHAELDSASINANGFCSDEFYKTYNIGYNSDMKHHYYFCKNLTDSSRFSPSRKCAAFTLAEVLITLGIIGIVAALTMPALISKYEHIVLKSQFNKFFSNLQNVFYMMRNDNGGIDYECYFNSPNYVTSECSQMWDEFYKKVKVVKTCTYRANGCSPTYKSKSEVLAQGGSVKNTGCSMDGALTKVHVLPDGSFIISTYTSVEHLNTFFAFDVNGNKGPNKWGYDMFYVSLDQVDKNKPLQVMERVCAMKEKGGSYLSEMLSK